MGGTEGGQLYTVQNLEACTVKKFNDFPILSRDVTNQTLPSREEINYSRLGRVWLVASWLGTGNGNLFLQCGCTFHRKGNQERCKSTVFSRETHEEKFFLSSWQHWR